jgi:hypothetical protein
VRSSSIATTTAPSGRCPGADQRATLGEAAAELGLSRRTADRRLAAARAMLGVATTAEALVAFRARQA